VVYGIALTTLLDFEQPQRFAPEKLPLCHRQQRPDDGRQVILHHSEPEVAAGAMLLRGTGILKEEILHQLIGGKLLPTSFPPGTII